MKRLLTILLLLCSFGAYSQIQPAPSGTLVPMSTNQAFFRASDSTYYFYNGTNYLWNYFLNKQQADKLYAPINSPTTTLFSLSTGYGLSGSSFNGSVARTFTADTTSASGLVSKGRLATNLGGYVPKTTTLTINGSTRDLSTNRTFNVGTVFSVGATAGTGISIAGTSPITSSGTYTITNTAPDQTVALTAGTGISTSGTYPNFTITNTAPSSGGTVTSVAALTLGTSGTDLSSSVANGTTTPVITLNVPTASAANRGALSSADWTTFNNKQGTISLTTTGTSGVATLIANTLNIPNYGSALSGYVPYNGATGSVTLGAYDLTATNLVASTKVNVGSPSGTTGSVNTGQDGIYSYRSSGRYVRFNTSGTFNDFLSLGAKLVMNYGFSGVVENISMFEGSAAGDGQFLVGSPTATNARFLLKGKDTGTTNYISRWFDSGNTEKFSVRNDGQTTVASLSAGGIVKSTAGVLGIATAGTDYITPTGSGSGLSGVVLTTTDQTISGYKTFDNGGSGSGIGLNRATTATGTQTIYSTAGLSKWGTGMPSSSTNYAIRNDGVSGINVIEINSATDAITLTGALSGTSATFSGDITATTGTVTLTNAANVYMPNVIRNGTTGNAYFQYSSPDTRFISLNGTGNIVLRNNANTTDNLTMSDAGDLVIAGSNATKASGTAWINPSDERLKENIQTYSKGLKELLLINPKTWYFNKNSGFDTKIKHLSPIAQELQEVMPEMVSTYKGKLNGKETELLRVDSSDMTWLLVKGMQEQQAIIEELIADIKLLKQK